MNSLKRSISFVCAALFALSVSYGQSVTLTQTSLTYSISNVAQLVTVASATGITSTPGTLLFVDKEAMYVLAVNGTQVQVSRGESGTAAVAHASGAMVLAGVPSAFFSYAPTGTCTVSQTPVTPWVNIATAAQYLCSSVTGTWVAGWQNDLQTPNVTAAVASAAGLITPSGPLFHVTGTAAVTGFNIPLGFAYGSFTVIPDGTFTTTSANNIALGSTAVVGKPITFVYDPVTAKFYPSY
jgi:hypothetical protein